METNYSISVQGINRELTASNGSYDGIEIGKFTHKAAVSVLERSLQISINPVHETGDFCPPNIIVRFGNRDVQSFSIKQGRLECSDTGKLHTPVEALMIAGGEIQENIQQPEKKIRAKQGKKSTNKKDINPANKNKINASDIDTGSGSPQFGLKVWKSKGWLDAGNFIPWLFGGLLFFIGLIVLGEAKDAHYAPVFFVLGVFVFLTIIPLKLGGKTTIRMGFDPKTDTVWMKKNCSKKLFFEGNVGQMTRFDIVQYNRTRMNRAWAVNPGTPLYIRDRSWVLAYLKPENPHYWTIYSFSFATKKDAAAAVRKLNALLASQNKN